MYSGINLKWYYTNYTFRLSIKDYIANIRVKFDHPFPSKPQHSSYKHSPIVYGAKIQYSAVPDDTPPLDAAGILRVQSIVGALL